MNFERKISFELIHFENHFFRFSFSPLLKQHFSPLFFHVPLYYENSKHIFSRNFFTYISFPLYICLEIFIFIPNAITYENFQGHCEVNVNQKFENGWLRVEGLKSWFLNARNECDRISCAIKWHLHWSSAFLTPENFQKWVGQINQIW